MKTTQNVVLMFNNPENKPTAWSFEKMVETAPAFNAYAEKNQAARKIPIAAIVQNPNNPRKTPWESAAVIGEKLMLEGFRPGNDLPLFRMIRNGDEQVQYRPIRGNGRALFYSKSNALMRPEHAAIVFPDGCIIGEAREMTDLEERTLLNADFSATKYFAVMAIPHYISQIKANPQISSLECALAAGTTNRGWADILKLYAASGNGFAVLDQVAAAWMDDKQLFSGMKTYAVAKKLADEYTKSEAAGQAMLAELIAGSATVEPKAKTRKEILGALGMVPDALRPIIKWAAGDASPVDFQNCLESIKAMPEALALATKTRDEMATSLSKREAELDATRTALSEANKSASDLLEKLNEAKRRYESAEAELRGKVGKRVGK